MTISELRLETLRMSMTDRLTILAAAFIASDKDDVLSHEVTAELALKALNAVNRLVAKIERQKEAQP